MWCEQYEPKKSHTRLKFNVDHLLIIFFVIQIYRVRFVSVNGEASKVKPSKKNFLKKLEKKILEQNFEKKILGKKYSVSIIWNSGLHTHTHTSGHQLKILFFDVLDHSEYADTNISNFFHENIASSVRKKNEKYQNSNLQNDNNCCGPLGTKFIAHRKKIHC